MSPYEETISLSFNKKKSNVNVSGSVVFQELFNVKILNFTTFEQNRLCLRLSFEASFNGVTNTVTLTFVCTSKVGVSVDLDKNEDLMTPNRVIMM